MESSHAFAAFALLVNAVTAQEVPRCMPMTIPTGYVGNPPLSYREFCLRNATSCELTGPAKIEWSPELHTLLGETNKQVNRAIEFVPDPQNSGKEEIWEYPQQGKGDCEDFMLEKRRLLVESGLPSASLTCGIAFHQVQLFPHAVLLVETTAGTFVLDNLYDDVMCWDAVPYFFTGRERSDGKWTRFQQP